MGNINRYIPAVFSRVRYGRGAVALLSLATLLVVLLACRANSSTAVASEEGLIWEAWELVSQSYVDSDKVDSERISNEIITSMLKAADQPPYPFLTNLEQTRRRVPRNVPAGLSNVWRAWEQLQELNPGIDPHSLATAGIKGLVQGLDDDSVQYLTPEDYDRARESPSGQYEGIGAYVAVQQSQIVLSPILGGPAEKAGIDAGDVLMAVDGESVEGMEPDAVVEKVRGSPRTKVKLTIMRPGEERPREFEVTRARVSVPTIGVRLLPGAIGYISIDEFRDGTAVEVLDVLERLKASEMLALILDLRLTSQGTLEAARKVAGQLMNDSLFVYELNRNGQRTDWLVESSDLEIEGLPLAVLINGGTAGAAEALAASLQASAKARMVGTKTQGRASGTTMAELSDGSAIRLATSRWYTPQGTSISQGVSPDIGVPLTEADVAAGRDSQLGAAYTYLDDLLPAFR